MQLKKIHLVVAISLFAYGFFVMIAFSISISNKQACKDDLPVYATAGCNYDGAQAVIFLILGLFCVLATPLGFFLTFWVYTLPGLFAAISIIMNIVYMLRYRTNNNWQFQLQEGKKKVWATEMRYLAMSSIFFMLIFILFFLGKLRSQMIKKQLNQAAKELQTPQRIHNNLNSSAGGGGSKKLSPRINIEFQNDTTQNQLTNQGFK